MDPRPPGTGDGRSARSFRFDRAFEFDVAPADLWAVLADTSSFPRWWPWLRSFEPVPLAAGSTTRAVIGPPLPYVVNVELTVGEVVDGELLAVDVTGDLEGPARLEVEPAPAGSRARLVWDLEVTRPMLKLAARVARPLLLWGHDWVVSNGVAQFRARAIDGAGPRH